jgi:hypothetical protein
VWSNESASPETITLLNHSTVIVSVEQYTPAGTMTHRKVVTLSKMQSLPFGRDMVYYTLK